MKSFTRQLMLAVALCSLAIVAGCAATATNVKQQVLETRIGYTDAVEAAATYGNPQFIPLCTTTAPTAICANPSIVKQIKVVKDAAKPVIDGADATVLDPAFDQSKGAAIVLSAQNALKALTAITEALHLKAPPKPSP